MTSNRLILFAGGGTGGHLTPGLAIAEQLDREPQSVSSLFVESGRPIERSILDPTWRPTARIEAPRLSDLKTRPWRFAASWMRASRAAQRLILRHGPAVVIGLGGASSAPVIRAARRFRIPIVLMEQNRVAGRATRYLARYADDICVNMPLEGQPLKTGRNTRTHIVGNPIRWAPDKAIAGDNPPSSARQKVLVVTGGSQGATAVNRLVTETVRQNASEFQDWTILHQTGDADEKSVRSLYDSAGITATVAAFTDQLPDWLDSARLTVARAGATTLSELALTGCPAIVVPYPSATQDHQRLNGEYYESSGGVIVQSQPNATEELNTSFSETLLSLMNDSERLDQMRQAQNRLATPDAANQVASLILSRLPVV